MSPRSGKQWSLSVNLATGDPRWSSHTSHGFCPERDRTSSRSARTRPDRCRFPSSHPSKSKADSDRPASAGRDDDSRRTRVSLRLQLADHNQAPWRAQRCWADSLRAPWTRAPLQHRERTPQRSGRSLDREVRRLTFLPAPTKASSSATLPTPRNRGSRAVLLANMRCRIRADTEWTLRSRRRYSGRVLCDSGDDVK